MPELTVYRNNTAPPPMVCMYCGEPATSTREWQEENHKPAPGGGGGTDLSPAPGGDDPVSLVIGLLMLPFALWELFKGTLAAIGAVIRFINRPGTPAGMKPPPPKEPRTTLVAVTTCERHRRFRARFVWAGAGMLLVLAALWTWAVLEARRVMGTEEVDFAVVLMMTAIFSTILLPVALGLWYSFGGPVIVERVTEGTVVLDRVRQAYFDATGLKASNAA